MQQSQKKGVLIVSDIEITMLGNFSIRIGDKKIDETSRRSRNMWTLLPQGYETHDGVHPNADYQVKYLAPMIKGFIEDKIYKN